MKMMRLLVLFSVLFFGFTLLFSGLLTADDEVPDFIELGKGVYKHPRKPLVPFEHLMHAEDFGVDCKECHHVYEDGENVWEMGDPVMKCEECHDLSESIGNVKNLRLAFHKNCKGCHRELVKEGSSDTAPYRKCSGCHIRD